MRSTRCFVLLSHRLWRRFAAPAGESAQDAPLRHLQAGRHRRDPGQHVGQSRHIGLHVTQELLQLVQHCWSMATRTTQSRGRGKKKTSQLMSTHIASPQTATFGGKKISQSVSSLNSWTFILPFSAGVTQSLCLCFTWNSRMKCVFMLPFACHWL